MDGAIKKNNLDCTQILFYHDELEYEVKEEQADFAGKLASKSFELAGKHHKFNVSIIGEYKIGRSWYDCHG
jgi:DNA polymerase I-like protein with 3'-5' exonuclease and polymerase domains